MVSRLVAGSVVAGLLVVVFAGASYVLRDRGIEPTWVPWRVASDQELAYLSQVETGLLVSGKPSPTLYAEGCSELAALTDAPGGLEAFNVDLQAAAQICASSTVAPWPFQSVSNEFAALLATYHLHTAPEPSGGNFYVVVRD